MTATKDDLDAAEAEVTEQKRKLIRQVEDADRVFAAALAEVMHLEAEVARFTEERVKWIRAYQAAFRRANSFFKRAETAEAERDQQREDIQRLVEALEDEHKASGCDDSLGPEVCATSLIIAEMEERYA